MGATYDGQDLKFDLEIRGMAFKTSKIQAELRKHLLELDTLRNKYQAKTDKVYPIVDLFKILWRMLDPVTLKEVKEKKFDSEVGKE